MGSNAFDMIFVPVCLCLVSCIAALAAIDATIKGISWLIETMRRREQDDVVFRIEPKSTVIHPDGHRLPGRWGVRLDAGELRRGPSTASGRWC